MAIGLARLETVNIALEYMNEAAYKSLRLGIWYLVCSATLLAADPIVEMILNFIRKLITCV